MIAKAKVFKGIEYIQISDLPLEQREILSNSINKSIVIKILVSGKILADCIQFKDYAAWFENVFKRQESKEIFQNSMEDSLTELVEKKSRSSY